MMRTFIIGLLVVVILMGLIIATIAFFPVLPYAPPLRRHGEEAEFDFNGKVGWYQMTDGSKWLITWGAENGLTMNRFEQLSRGYLKPLTTDRFAWRNSQGEEKYQVNFARNSDGKVIGLSWVDENGERHRAKRLEAFAYNQAEVRFQNELVELAATLLTPVSTGRHPAVVFIHGSGVSDRNNLWYLHVATYLAKNGIIVLFPDKRGCGKSGGKWHVASFEDFAGDALAGVNYLKRCDSVDQGRIGIIGFSQGGWIAPLAASKLTDVKFVVNVAGAAVTPNQQIRHEITADIRNSGVPAAVASVMAPAFVKRAKNRRSLWWEKNGDFDPIPYWSSLTIPVNIVYGKEDEDDNVPVEKSLVRLKQVKLEGKNSNFVIKVYEDSGHAIEDPNAATRFVRKDYLDSLIEWIHAIGIETGEDVLHNNL